MNDIPRRRRLPKITRDTVLFLIGASGFLHVVFLESGSAERPTVLAACVGLMVSPGMLRAYARASQQDDGQHGRDKRQSGGSS